MVRINVRATSWPSCEGRLPGGDVEVDGSRCPERREGFSRAACSLVHAADRAESVSRLGVVVAGASGPCSRACTWRVRSPDRFRANVAIAEGVYAPASHPRFLARLADESAGVAGATSENGGARQ
jgi:hypothetical protein